MNKNLIPSLYLSVSDVIDVNVIYTIIYRDMSKVSRIIEPYGEVIFNKMTFDKFTFINNNDGNNDRLHKLKHLRYELIFLYCLKNKLKEDVHYTKKVTNNNIKVLNIKLDKIDKFINSNLKSMTISLIKSIYNEYHKLYPEYKLKNYKGVIKHNII